MNDASTNNGLQSWFTESAAYQIRNQFLYLRGGMYRVEKNAQEQYRLETIQVSKSVVKDGFNVVFVLAQAKGLTAKEFCAANGIPFDETKYERVFKT